MQPKELVQPRAVLLSILALLAVNLAVAGKLFGVQFLAYNGSVEGSFIAISRIMAKYPGQWSWWPFWACGMPFETAYLPFTHWLVAGFILLTHLDPGRAFHIVVAAAYVGSALSVFWMALVLSRKWAASFFAALVYSCFSFSNLIVPEIRADAGGLWNLRRLQVLVYWGESPHTVALALLPIAVVCFHYGLTTPGAKWKIFAGIMAAAVALSNAFGIAALVFALLCWTIAFAARPWWKAPLIAGGIGIVSYCWVSPWLSPAMIHAIRISAPTAGGDFRYRAESWFALALVAAGFVAAAVLLRRLKAAPYLQFFLLFAYIHGAILLTWYLWRVAVIPQPGRYQLELDLSFALAAVFLAAAFIPPRLMRAAGVTGAGILALLIVHAALYANGLILPAQPERLVEYRLARWMDRNMKGQRAFIGGAASLLYNAVTDNPQMKGSHDQHAVNPFMAIAAFTIYSGMNAGDRDAEYSVFWLKAYGAHAISVPGPDSGDYYKPFVHPRKFEGILPVLWRDGDTTLYQVPSRSTSLAHVIPASAVVTRTPLHGLDIAPARAFVDALDDPQFPPADFQWTAMNEARIHATLQPGQVISVQETYSPGWEAWTGGQWQPVQQDGLGLMVITPDCAGACDLTLRYTGGLEHLLTRALSAGAVLIAAFFALLAGRRVP